MKRLMTLAFISTIAMATQSAFAIRGERASTKTKSFVGSEPSLSNSASLGEKLVRVKPIVQKSFSGLSTTWGKLETKELNPTTREIEFVSGELKPNTVDEVLSALGLSGITLAPAAQGTLQIGQLRVLQFNRVVDGVAVEGAYLILRYQGNQLIHVVNYLRGKAEVYKYDGQVTADTAKNRVLSDSKQTPTSATLAYRVHKFADGVEIVPVFKVLVAVNDPLGKWQYSVDARTNKILEIKNLYHFSDGLIQGTVLPRTVGDAQTLVPLKFQRVKGSSNKATSTDTLGNFTYDGSFGDKLTFGLSSLYFDILNKGGANSASTQVHQNKRVELVWNDANSDLAERNSVYHLDEVRMLVKKYMDAIGVTNDFLTSPLAVNVNINDVCNAFYNGSSVNFFQAGDYDTGTVVYHCNNTAHIGDVMYHEWGHGFDDHVAGGINDGAFSEGIGDIMGMMMTHSHLLGPSFFTDGTPVRELETDKKYPDDVPSDGEVHDEGLIIGSTYWDLWKLLLDQYGQTRASDEFAKLFLYSILNSQTYTDNYQAVVAVDGANAPAGQKGPNYCMINEAFNQHGLATRDDVCLEGIKTNSHSFSDDGVVNANESINLALTMYNNSRDATHDVHLKLSTDSNAISITHAEVNAGDFASYETKDVNGLSFRVAATAVCNSKHQMTLEKSYNEKVQRDNFEIVIGKAESANVANSNNLTTPIPDNTPSGISSEINLPASSLIVEGKVSVTLDITHTYRGDVTVKLKSPSGKVVTLLNREGGSAHDIKQTVEVTGFQDETPGGIWVLLVNDLAQRDEGTLNSWKLEVPAYRSNCL